MARPRSVLVQVLLSNRGSRLYAVDGWIGNRCGCVTNMFLLWPILFSVINSEGPTLG